MLLQRSGVVGTRRWCRASAGEDVGGKQVVVVGGGVGGLCTAGLLRKQGFRVKLLEKNAQLGGRLSSEEVDGYRFDTGPSLLLFPRTYIEMFSALGVTGIELEEIKPAAYRLFFGGDGNAGDTLDLLVDEEQMMAQFEAREKGAGQRYLAFLKMARGALDLGMPNFIERDLSKIGASSLLELLPQAAKVNPLELLGPLDLVLRGFFKSVKLRQAFTFQTLYVGLSPYTAPGVFSLLAATELTDGVWYPIGGFKTIRDGIVNAICGLGVEIATSTDVEGIVVDGGRVVGVRTSTGMVEADIVVCNRDLADSYEMIEGDSGVVEYAQATHRKLGSKAYSNGVISYLFCVDKRVDKLLHHNVFVNASDPKGAWRPIKSSAELLQYPNFYVHVPSKTDPTAAPDGHESIMVLLPVANLQGDVRNSASDDMDELVSAGRRVVIEFLTEATGDAFQDHIVGEKVIDPTEWRRRYGLRFGAAFGLSHGLDQLSLFRPSAEDETIEGLFFTGASTRPGNGVPLVMIGARLVAESIIERYSHYSRS